MQRGRERESVICSVNHFYLTVVAFRKRLRCEIHCRAIVVINKEGNQALDLYTPEYGDHLLLVLLEESAM